MTSSGVLNPRSADVFCEARVPFWNTMSGCCTWYQKIRRENVVIIQQDPIVVTVQLIEERQIKNQDSFYQWTLKEGCIRISATEIKVDRESNSKAVSDVTNDWFC
jgi:hypothetical protein